MFYRSIFLILISSCACAADFQFRDISSFKGLPEFENVEQFESSYEQYEIDCLNLKSGGRAGLPCYISSKLWDRELNRYYNLLRELLSDEEKVLLKNSQLKWIVDRDETMLFHNHNVLKNYEGKSGTMYDVFAYGDNQELLKQLTKDRAIILKRWYGSYFNRNNQPAISSERTKDLLSKLMSGTEKEKSDALYALHGEFAEMPASAENLDFFDKNIEQLLHVLQSYNPQLRADLTELLTNYVEDKNNNSRIVVATWPDQAKKRAIDIIIENLKSTDKRLAQFSLDGLIRVNACSKKELIIKNLSLNNGKAEVDHAVLELAKTCK